MKKIFSTIILGVLLVGLVAPLAVSAQKEKLKECCVIKNAIEWKKGTIGKPATPGTVDPSPENCATTDPRVKCKLGKGDMIGPKFGTVCPIPGNPTAKVTHYSDHWGMICIVNTITTATNWIFYILMVVVVIMIVIGGATYMLAAGDPEKAGKGKKIIVYGIIGLVIALVAKLIPSIVKLIVGVS